MAGSQPASSQTIFPSLEHPTLFIDPELPFLRSSHEFHSKLSYICSSPRGISSYFFLYMGKLVYKLHIIR